MKSISTRPINEHHFLCDLVCFVLGPAVDQCEVRSCDRPVLTHALTIQVLEITLPDRYPSVFLTLEPVQEGGGGNRIFSLPYLMNFNG